MFCWKWDTPTQACLRSHKKQLQAYNVYVQRPWQTEISVLSAKLKLFCCCWAYATIMNCEALLIRVSVRLVLTYPIIHLNIPKYIHGSLSFSYLNVVRAVCKERQYGSWPPSLEALDSTGYYWCIRCLCVSCNDLHGPHQRLSGVSYCQGHPVLPCSQVKSQPSWQSGLVRTCKANWDCS